MEAGCDFVSALLSIGEGGTVFFASCLLHLNPDELKACRLVNRTWNEFIRKEVWGSTRRRLQLREKLNQRWKLSDPPLIEVGEVRNPILGHSEVDTVDSIFCDNSHAFCGLPCGKVGVYCLTTNEWVRNLMPGGVTEGHNETNVAGSDLVVAAVMKYTDMVTVWSSKKNMEELFCLNARDFPCLDDCEHTDRNQVTEIQVVGDKVFLLRKDREQGKTSLIGIKRIEQTVWETSILACLDGFPSATLATEENWIAVLRINDWYGPWHQYINTSTHIKLWECNTFRQDISAISLPDDPRDRIYTKIALKLPFIVVVCNFCVDVFQLASDNLMEDKRLRGSLIKTIPMDSNWSGQLTSNELFFGFVLLEVENFRQAVTLIEKKTLLDASIPSEETEKRQILLPDLYKQLDGGAYIVGMNTTTLVFAHQVVYTDDEDGEEVVIPLHKNDFWRTSNIE